MENKELTTPTPNSEKAASVGSKTFFLPKISDKGAQSRDPKA